MLAPTTVPTRASHSHAIFAPALLRAGQRRRPAEGEAGVHVEFELAVHRHVRPYQRCQAAVAHRPDGGCLLGFGEDVLDHQRVDVDHRGLHDVQAQHAHFLLVAAIGGDVAHRLVGRMGRGTCEAAQDGPRSTLAAGPTPAMPERPSSSFRTRTLRAL